MSMPNSRPSTNEALPVSVLTSFVPLLLFGFTLNTMSLLGLSLAIGILIDDAIVVRENIVRHVEMGRDHMTAAHEGTDEIGLAVAATTFSIVAALMTEGRFRRAYLGLAGGPRPLPPKIAREVGRDRGIEVVQVVDGSPAARAGLRPEDLILDVDGEPMEAMDDLQRLMVGDAVGRRVSMRVFRDGGVTTLDVTPVELLTG